MPQDHECNPFRESTPQYSYEPDHEAYYTRGNYRITNNIQITNKIKMIDNTKKKLLDHQHHSITDNKLKKARIYMTEIVFNFIATYVKVYIYTT